MKIRLKFIENPVFLSIRPRQSNPQLKVWNPHVFQSVVLVLGLSVKSVRRSRKVGVYVKITQMAYNVLWYGVVRDFEALSYQFTPTFFTSHKRSKTAETRMHYTMCCVFVLSTHAHPCNGNYAL
jgi:hypothetical protein